MKIFFSTGHLCILGFMRFEMGISDIMRCCLQRRNVILQAHCRQRDILRNILFLQGTGNSQASALNFNFLNFKLRK